TSKQCVPHTRPFPAEGCVELFVGRPRQSPAGNEKGRGISPRTPDRERLSLGNILHGCKRKRQHSDNHSSHIERQPIGESPSLQYECWSANLCRKAATHSKGSGLKHGCEHFADWIQQNETKLIPAREASTLNPSSPVLKNNAKCRSSFPTPFETPATNTMVHFSPLFHICAGTNSSVPGLQAQYSWFLKRLLTITTTNISS
ncbi:unnamed protein product, partial [Ectocarpus sp. 4 AP-2014]